MRPQVRIPSTISMLFQFRYIPQIETTYIRYWNVKRTNISKKVGIGLNLNYIFTTNYCDQISIQSVSGSIQTHDLRILSLIPKPLDLDFTTLCTVDFLTKISDLSYQVFPCDASVRFLNLAFKIEDVFCLCCEIVDFSSQRIHDSNLEILEKIVFTGSIAC